MPILALLASVAYAGFVQPIPVDVDLVNKTAIGDQNAARESANDVEFIGCGTRFFDDGTGNAFRFGFCQATDADGDSITCFTQLDSLIDEMRANSDYAFITFNWQDDGSGGAECIRVGFSTQSLYLPASSDPGLESHTHEYLTGEGEGHNNTTSSTSSPIPEE